MEFHQIGILQLEKYLLGKEQHTHSTVSPFLISKGGKLPCCANLMSSTYTAYFHYIGWTQAESKNSQAVIDVRWL